MKDKLKLSQKQQTSKSLKTKTKKKPAGKKSKNIKSRKNSGKLKIGDSWNAITIIALSQDNPLKAVAEFVENSIDARAKNITIVRGREKGELYLKIIDDGEGIPLNKEGIPDFKYVATHICDSIKKRLKREGVSGLQGEFGIGLLSFWTVGTTLYLSSAGSDGKTYVMQMKKGEEGYTISKKRTLFSNPGTELLIKPLLPGVKQLNGERIQNYLASELRDRIKKSGVKIKIIDRYSRKEFEVKPREYSGRHLHEFEILPVKSSGAKVGEIYLELYLNNQSPDNRVSLFRSGTRVLESITELDDFDKPPWTEGFFQGMIDVPFLQLTPGTRRGIIRDHYYWIFIETVKSSSLEDKLNKIIELEKQAIEEEASKNILKSVKRALQEALLMLPKEEYDWFDIQTENRKRKGKKELPFDGENEGEADGKNQYGERELAEGVDSSIAERQHANPADESAEPETPQEFYEYPGPLYKAIISPASCVVKVKEEKLFRCIPRDKKRRIVEDNINIEWDIKEGEGVLSKTEGEFVTYLAPDEPGLTVIRATVTQKSAKGIISCTAEAIVTVTDSLLKHESGEEHEKGKGLPGYTFLRKPGELWRSKYDEERNLIIINNGHKDYIYANQKKSRKLRYICRLFSKELVLKNFIGYDKNELLERLIELSLYSEENLH